MTDDVNEATSGSPPVLPPVHLNTEPIVIPEYLPGTNWRLWHGALVIFTFLVSAIVGLAIVGAVTGNALDDLSANQQLGILGPVQFVGGMAGLAVVALLYDKRRPSLIYGLRLKWRDWWAFPAGIGLQIGAALILAILAFVLFPNSDPPQQAAAELTSDLSSWGIGLGLITVVVLAPIYEEALFRGLVLSRLVRLMQPWPAYLVNGLLFAGIHVLFDANAWFASIALFPLGTALAWLAHRSGDISRSILAHMGVNTLGAIGLFFGDEITRWAEDLQQEIEAAARLVGLG